jgi:hypothetical protein
MNHENAFILSRSISSSNMTLEQAKENRVRNPIYVSKTTRRNPI